MRLVGLVAASCLLAMVLFVGSGNPDGILAPFRVVAMFCYWPGLFATRPVIDLIPYLGWAISLLHLMVAMTLQHLVISAWLQRRNASRNAGAVEPRGEGRSRGPAWAALAVASLLPPAIRWLGSHSAGEAWAHGAFLAFNVFAWSLPHGVTLFAIGYRGVTPAFAAATAVSMAFVIERHLTFEPRWFDYTANMYAFSVCGALIAASIWAIGTAMRPAQAR